MTVLSGVSGYYLCPVKGCMGTLYLHDPQSGVMSCSECGYEKEAKK